MIRRREALFFLFMVLPIIGHVVILPMLYDFAGRDAWISVLLAAPFGIVIAYMTWKFLNLEPGTTLKKLSTDLWGPWIGFLFNLIWFAFFFFMGIVTLTSVMDMLQGGFYQETPMWFIGGSFMVFIAYCMTKGIRVIAWMAGILTLFIMISGHSISLLLSPVRSWGQLLPILEFGWNPVISGAILLCANWSEMFVLAVLQFSKVETKGMLYLLLLGSFANTIMMLSVAAGTITVFGWEQTDTLLYPVLSSVRMITLGFIDRFDVYGLMLMTFGSFIRQSLFLHAVIELLPFQKVVAKYRTIAIIAMGLALYFTSLFLFTNKLTYDEYLKNYVLVIFLWPLPLLYILKHWWSKRKQRTSKNPASKGSTLPGSPQGSS
ncbi:GerAB/ArcD/ProY family transporter [Ferviditalea candida]|uniref:Endospore germination permease n=1 Tax=Ferviditalea candida TaxID=3108399 RepID=A0ABU5ZMH1_9BACL|nr:endospore germination permease [Paenibacillaceae bacterium T2]